MSEVANLEEKRNSFHITDLVYMFPALFAMFLGGVIILPLIIFTLFVTPVTITPWIIYTPPVLFVLGLNVFAFYLMVKHHLSTTSKLVWGFFVVFFPILGATACCLKVLSLDEE